MKTPARLRCLALLFVVMVASCERPDRSGVEEVFLERETTDGPMAYESLRDRAYDTLSKDGAKAALPLFQAAYKSPGAEATSWELLPTIGRLTLIAGDSDTAATHLRTARLAQRLSLGELVCQGPGRGVFRQEGRVATPAYAADELGSALLVSTTMCATRDIYPRRAASGTDALFERKAQAVEALLTGTGEAPSKTP